MKMKLVMTGPGMGLMGLTLKLLALLAIAPMMLLATPALSGSVTLQACGPTPPATIDYKEGVWAESYNNNDALAKGHSNSSYPYNDGSVIWGKSALTLDCATSSCIISFNKGSFIESGGGKWMEGSVSGHLYLKMVDGDRDPVAYTSVSCEVFNQPNIGFLHDTNDFSCIQKADTGMYADLHMWDHCNFGNPQDNRQWEYTASETRIRVAVDRSRCLTVDSKPPDGVDKMGVPYYFPEPRSGDRVVLRDCLVSSTIQDLEYNVKGNHQIRMLAFPNYCMYRSSSNNGDGLYVDLCDSNNTNGRWNINWQ